MKYIANYNGCIFAKLDHNEIHDDVNIYYGNYLDPIVDRKYTLIKKESI